MRDIDIRPHILLDVASAPGSASDGRSSGSRSMYMDSAADVDYNAMRLGLDIAPGSMGFVEMDLLAGRSSRESGAVLR